MTRDNTPADEQSVEETTNEGEETEEQDEPPLTFADPPSTTFDDMAGLTEEINMLEKAVVEPLVDANRIARTHGVLLVGEPGNGKTRLANALVGELSQYGFEHAEFNMDISRSEMGSKFEEAIDELREEGPSVLVIDPMQSPISQDILSSIKRELQHLNASTKHQVLVVMVLEPEENFGHLSRALESFEVKLKLDNPDEKRRQEFLQAELTELCQNGGSTLEAHDIDFPGLATKADDLSMIQLMSVCERALHNAETPDGASDSRLVSESTIEDAIQSVKEECELTRESSPDSHTDWQDSVLEPEIPDVSFDDIGGLDDVKETLRVSVEFPTQYESVYDEFDLPSSQGIVLHGPPGNGKTMLAKALANETERSFIALAGPEMKHPLVGQTEQRLRDVFETARENAPSILFLDEFDALAPNRNELRRQYSVDSVNTLLSELDGLNENEDVLVVAATNRLDSIDPAALRPGRLGEHIEIGLPDEEGQAAIVEAVTRSHPLAKNVTVEWIASQLPRNLSGAEIAALCRDTLQSAIQEATEVDEDIGPDDVIVTRDHYRALLADREYEPQSSEAIAFR